MTTRQISDDSDNVVGPVSNENFEFWLRMATDNKINTDNSWNFALIDYFHDFSILREGDGVNFQRASTTLDGCMKIYSQRVDSAVKDTGTLLSTLNIHSTKRSKSKSTDINNNDTSNSNTNNDGEADEEEAEEAEENDGQQDDRDDDTEAGNKRRGKIRKQLELKSNLSSSFNSIKMKDLSKPVKIDPVFKNALTIFDEGGAKGLLNNILRISNEGKVIFDVTNDDDYNNKINSYDDDADADDDDTNGVITTADENENDHVLKKPDSAPLPLNDSESDKLLIQNLKKFVSFDLISTNLNTCPSLPKLENVSNGSGDAAALLEELDGINVSEIELDLMQTLSKENVDDDGDNIMNDYDNNYVDFGYEPEFDNNSNKNNSFNNEDAVSNISKRTQFSIIADNENDSDLLPNLFDETTNFEPNPTPQADNIFMSKLTALDIERLNMFNKIGSRSNLYWKILRFKKSVNYERNLNIQLLNNGSDEQTNHNKKQIKKRNTPKQSFSIDFMSDFDEENEEEKVFETTDYLSKILLGEKDRKSGRNLMINDTPFTVKNLAFLSLKPTQLSNTIILSRRKPNHKHREEYNNIPANEEYFAETYKTNTRDNSILSELDDRKSSINEYNNDFDDFAANGAEGFDMPLSPFGSPFQSQPLSQQHNRPDTLAYAKRSKKVDIKLLKQNLWSSIEEISTHKKKRTASHFDEVENNDDYNETNEDKNSNNADKSSSNTSVSDVDDEGEIDTMKFTKVVEIMSSKYTNNVKKDLSTSFCFICLLHLANEQGLMLETRDNYEDIVIHK